MKPKHLNTPWKEDIDPSCLLNQYPRPQLIREEWMNLNGHWDYSILHRPISKNSTLGSIKWEGKILVPFALETDLSAVCRPLLPDQSLWYRRLFNIPETWYGKNVILNFEAVDWFCVCYVNGKKVGSHQGGYIPFHFDITEYLNPSANEIILAVEDSSDEGFQQRGKQVLKPEGIYYEATSGIWQTVWLEPVDPVNRIESISFTPDVDKKLVAVEVLSLINDPVKILISDGKETHAAIEGKSGEILEIPVHNPRLWSPDDPFLYDVSIELLHKDKIVDSIVSYCGMRTISSQKGKNGHRTVVLNGKPVFLHGPLDQGYWPESGMTPPSEEAILFDLKKTIELGFNMTRKHIKVESRRWYYHADRLGLLVVQDAVSGGKPWGGDFFTDLAFFSGIKIDDSNAKAYRKGLRQNPESRKDFEDELFSMMDHLHNHPSIVVWVPFNEAWGQYDSVRIAEEVHSKDPTRLVDHVSGWVDQIAGDFCSKHTYIIPLKKKKKNEKRIHFISEYGGYNLNVPNHMWNENKKFGYKDFKDKESLTKAYTKLIQKQLIPLIKDGLSAAVYTQLSDVEIESNGFFSYDRKIQKIDTDIVKTLNMEIYKEFNRRNGV